MVLLIYGKRQLSSQISQELCTSGIDDSSQYLIAAGKRYCMNAAALTFIPKGEPLPLDSQPAEKQAQAASS